MLDEKELREVYCECLVEAAKTDPAIVVLEADLMKCIKTEPFRKAYPDRFFDVGIAEANMVGIAAGLAACGKKPYCSSFAPFMTRRAYDQVFISVAYSKLNVKLVGTDPGISAELNGGTHMPFEDMGIMRAIPGMICVEPTDATQLRQLMPQILACDKPLYLRLFRKQCQKVYSDDAVCDLFRANTLREGKDATVIASGIMVSRALEAAQALAEQGISVRVVNTATWKPIDEQAICAAARETGAIVTAENHNIHDGLFSAVSEVVVRNCPVPMECVGVQDKFGEVGKMPYLSERFGLRTEDIVEAVRRAIARK